MATPPNGQRNELWLLSVGKLKAVKRAAAFFDGTTCRGEASRLYILTLPPEVIYDFWIAHNNRSSVKLLGVRPIAAKSVDIR